MFRGISESIFKRDLEKGTGENWLGRDVENITMHFLIVEQLTQQRDELVLANFF